MTVDFPNVQADRALRQGALGILAEEMDLDDADYPFTWLPSEDHHAYVAELTERGPEAFPD